jgi:hypothetical protein
MVRGADTRRRRVLRRQITEATVEFNAKISSVTSSEQARSTTSVQEVAVKGGFIKKVDYKNTFTSQSASKHSNRESREYSMRVFVKVRQAALPEGLKVILDSLADAVKKRVDDSPSE